MQKPTICNVLKKNLNKGGYDSLDDWVSSSSNHLFIDNPSSRYQNVEKSKWTNDFRSLKLYEEHIRGNEELWTALDELSGCVLGTWTYPRRSHANVLVSLFCEKHGIEHSDGPDFSKYIDDGVVNMTITIGGEQLSEEDAYALLMHFSKDKSVGFHLNGSTSDRRMGTAALNILAGTYNPNAKSDNSRKNGRRGSNSGESQYSRAKK